MGQYRLRMLQERRVRNTWEQKSRLLEEIAVVLGANEDIDVDALLTKLREKGFSLSKDELYNLLEMLNLGTKAKAREILKSLEERDRDLIRKLFKEDKRRGKLKDIVEVLFALKDNRELMVTVARDLLNKLTNPGKYVDVNWWIKAWSRYAKERSYVPAFFVAQR